MRTNKSCPLWDPNDHVRQKDTYNQNVATKLGYDEATKRRSIKLSINAGQVDREVKADKDQKKLKFKVDLNTLPENPNPNPNPNPTSTPNHAQPRRDARGRCGANT